MNACSILNKLSDLETFLHMDTPAFVGISETHMYPELSDELIYPNRYNVSRKDRNRYGGGVALLVLLEMILLFLRLSFLVNTTT